MVGPGSGVAPFRGFIRHYAALARQGVAVGKMVLFFGCRSRQEDFIYEEEWQEIKDAMKDNFELVVAFSRNGPQKVYVQDSLKEMTVTVNDLLQQNAHFYVCGDAKHMAADIGNTLTSILAEQRGVGIEEAKTTIKEMKALRRYQEDIW